MFSVTTDASEFRDINNSPSKISARLFLTAIRIVYYVFLNASCISTHNDSKIYRFYITPDDMEVFIIQTTTPRSLGNCVNHVLL